MIELIIWIVCAFICAYIADKKNRNKVAWFIIGLLTGVLGLIVILILKKRY